MGPSPQINSPCRCVAAAVGKQGKKITRCAGRWNGLGFGDPSGLLATWNILWWEVVGVAWYGGEGYVTGGPQGRPGAWAGGAITVKDSLSWR